MYRFLLISLCFLPAITITADEIYVHAAASLSDALTLAADEFHRVSKHKIVLNIASSSVLARQIEAGVPADLFISADQAKMDQLNSAGLIIPHTQKPFLSNTLVIVTSSDSSLRISAPQDLVLITGRIAIAEYETVPAGIYARTYLQKTGLWEKLSKKIIPVQNVRAALAAVEAGNVDFAFVYKTDAAVSQKARIVYEVAPEEGPDIQYVIAILKQSKNRKASVGFYEFLLGPAGIKIFQKFGFLVRRD